MKTEIYCNSCSDYEEECLLFFLVWLWEQNYTQFFDWLLVHNYTLLLQLIVKDREFYCIFWIIYENRIILYFLHWLWGQKCIEFHRLSVWFLNVWSQFLLNFFYSIFAFTRNLRDFKHKQYKSKENICNSWTGCTDIFLLYFLDCWMWSQFLRHVFIDWLSGQNGCTFLQLII